MAKHTVTLIPGDGIGPELTTAMRRVVEATGVDIEWEIAEAGADVIEKYGTPLPESRARVRSARTRSPSRARSPRRSAPAFAA